MKLNLKKFLLTGTALIAVGSFAVSAEAAVLTFTSGGTTTATGTDTIDVDSQSGFTNSTLNFNGAGAVAVTAFSSAGGGAGNIGALNVTSVAGANSLTVGEGLQTVTFTINGSVAGDVSANDLTILVNAANGGGNGNSTLNLAGTTINLGTTGTGITLDSDAGGRASVVFNGTGAQTLTGKIDGQAAGDGVVSVTNTGGTVTFGNNVGGTNAVGHIGIGGGSGTSTAVFNGTVTTSNASGTLGGDGNIQLGQTDGGGSNTTFKNTVAVTGGGIILGTGATADTNTVTFDATGGSFSVTGAISGGSATDTDTLTIAGGANTVTFATDMGSNIDGITITANSTLAAKSLNAPITLNTGSTLTTTTDGKIFTGDITGAGTLAIANNTTLVGSATGLTAATVATAKTLTIDATAANRTLTATTTTLTGTGALALTNAANTITITNAITTTGASAITTSGGAGTITFGGDVGTVANAVSTLTPADNVTTSAINANGSLYIGTITLGQNDTLNLLGTTGTVSGVINGAGAGKGAVVVGNGTAASNYTFGTAASGTTTLAGFQVSAASTATVKNNISTTATAGVAGINNLGTLNIDASANTVTLATATGKTVLNGTTKVTGAQNVSVTATQGVIVDGALSSVLSGTSKTLTLNGTGGNSIGTNANTTITAGNQIVLGSATTLGSSGHVTTLNIQRTADFDPTTTTVVAGGANAVTVAAGTGTLAVAIGGGSLPLVNGDAITVITSTGGSNFGTLVGNGTITLQNTGLVTLTNNASDATALKVKAVFNSPAAILSTDANVSTATALLNFPAATGTLATARVNLLTAPTAAAANAVAESLSPPADGAAATASVDVSGRVLDLSSQRLASLREGDTSSGIATGTFARGQRAWGEVFGRTIDQDNRSGTAGYDADTGGLAFGMDGETASGGHLGVEVSYANTDISSDNANRTDTDLDSYQIGLYGDMPFASNTFVNGMVGYVFNQNETTRHNVGGIAGLTANGDFNAHQFVAQMEVGRDFDQGGGLTVTPTALANYTYYKPEDYTESGAGTANLNVNGDALNALDLGVGVDVAWLMEQADGSKLRPSLSAGYRYDVIGDSFDSTSSFTGGGGAFNTQGVDPARGTLNLGAGIKYFTVSNWDISAQYNYDTKSDYSAHTGQLRAAYKF